MSETIINHETERTDATAPATQLSTLPEHPVVIIEPGRGFVKTWLRELWAYRELLFFLALRDVKVRYKQTALGVLWVIMQPLLMTVIFTVFLGVLARVPTGGQPYALVVFIGLLPWSFFANSVMPSVVSIVGNSNLITKVYFPRVLIPAATVTARLVDFAVGFAVLCALLIYYGVPLTWNVLMLPVLIVLTTLLTLACGTLAAALNVLYRDVSLALPVLIQLWMFASPVVYPASLVRNTWPRLFRLYALNPMVGIIEGYRSALLSHPFEWATLLWSAAVTVVAVVGSAYVFRRVEKRFADVI